MYWRRPRRWADLPPDLVREISRHLHDAGDFVRFHAVCTSWREYSLDSLPSHPTTTTARTRQQFLPWLLAPDKKVSDSLNLRCVFSKATFRAPPPTHRCRNWVAAADGTAVRYFSDHLTGLPALHDSLTGAVTRHLPLFPDEILQWQWEENLSGIVYGDGAILLYNDPYDDDDGTFRVALLRPGPRGDAADTDGDQWTVVERTFEAANYGECCAAYHGGRILLTVEASLWHIVTPSPDGARQNARDDVLVPRPWLPGEVNDYEYQYSYVLESRGELLWASLQLRADVSGKCGLLLALSLEVSVHALEDGEEAPQWVRKKDAGRSLADRVLFLCWPNSFAVDASRLGVDGGCAYFVFEDKDGPPHRRLGVCRYDLVDDESKFIEWLPLGWDNVMCTWLVPQPSIAPIQEIYKRMDAQRHQRQLQMPPTCNITRIDNFKQYEPCFRLLVRNLPLKVNGTRLHHFFSNYGKVSEAEVIYYRKTKVSQGIALVTMATMHAKKKDALVALSGLVLDGCRLEVSLIQKGGRVSQRRWSDLLGGMYIAVFSRIIFLST